MALRIISWPMGFIILAKGAQNFVFWSGLAWTVVYLGLAWVCVNAFGLNGTGIAFFLSYVFHCFLIYAIVRPLSGFRWSAANIRTGLLFLSVIAVVFCGFYLLPPLLAAGIHWLSFLAVCTRFGFSSILSPRTRSRARYGRCSYGSALQLLAPKKCA